MYKILCKYNSKIPHSAFNFQTPQEIYLGLWNEENDIHISKIKKDALIARKEFKSLRCKVCTDRVEVDIISGAPRLTVSFRQACLISE